MYIFDIYIIIYIYIYKEIYIISTRYTMSEINVDFVMRAM